MIKTPTAATRLLYITLALLAAGPTRARADVHITLPAHFAPARPKIPNRTFSLADFGAVPDGKTLNTDAFQRAITAVDHAGGGKLVVPRGIYRTLPFVLCSNLDLHLDAGAVIEAPATFTEMGIPEPESLTSQAEVDARVKVPEPLITGRDLHDVALTGPGTIDGNGAHWWAWSERAERAHHGRLVYPRPHLVAINGCERLYIADITLTNSSKFHLVPANIKDLTIERVKVRAPFNAPNTDAIDPGPVVNAWIHDCDVDTGDDDIVIKSGGTNVLIEDCRIKHGHGISIGSGTTVGIHNMLVRRCSFDGADNGIRIKSMRGAGGETENVRYTEITMRNVANPITIDSNYVDNNRPNFKGDPTKIPSVHNILIDHVTAEACTNAGKISGLPDVPVRDVILRDVRIAADNPFEMRETDGIVFDHVTFQIKKGLAPPRPSEIQ